MGDRIGDANTTACATMVDEWVRCGVTHAVVAPGSRSTPMAIALADRAEISTHVVHDERVAAFVALGLGLDGDPAVVLCTSGTAAANFHPAVVEAGLSDVPMIVCTADRPPELRGVGAPQTIDQLGLYGSSVRWFHDARVPDEADPAGWRPLAQRVHATARTGPVHLNLPFREPLLGTAGQLPQTIGDPIPVPRAFATSGPVAEEFDLPRGVIIAGGRSGVDGNEVVAVSERLGWPILADPCSGLRRAPTAVTAFESLLRHHDFAAAHVPDVVIRFGRPPASKILTQWVVASGAPVFQVGGPGVIDPDGNVVASCTVDDLAPLTGSANTPWLARWRHANIAAESALDVRLGGSLSEPSVARVVADAVRDGQRLVVASSMPVRDLEWFGGTSANAHANRGANGIDGVVSTGVGLALAGWPTVVVVGDVAFVHDSNALIGLAERGVDLCVVVVDNDGGGIFSFLPQARVLASPRFEQLFGTPHGADVCAVAGAHGIAASTARDVDELRAAVNGDGTRLVRIMSDRTANVGIHDDLHAAVSAALG